MSNGVSSPFISSSSVTTATEAEEEGEEGEEEGSLIEY